MKTFSDIRHAKRLQSEEEDDARARGIRTKAELSQIVRIDQQIGECSMFEAQYLIITVIGPKI